jgi:hypothetical protein
MPKTRSATTLALLPLLAGVASADVIYSNDFERGVLGPEWSSNARLDQHESFSRFNGRYSDTGITLSLTLDPPPGGKQAKFIGHTGAGAGVSPIGKVKVGDGGDGGGGDGGDGGGGGGEEGTLRYTLRFDLYIIDSWDGDGPAYGPDHLEVRANADVIFRETFSNGDKPQSFRAPDVGPVHLGYSPAWEDSIYRGVEITFDRPADATKLNLTWEGIGLQGIYDESWGIDNVTLTRHTRSVPAPGVLSAGVLGMLVATRRRRS